jgi:hypothetical protein
MLFANETPLDDVLKYIKQATTTKTFSGIPIYVDPLGLQAAERSLNSTVRLNRNGLALKRTLALILGQLGLAYAVKDGFLIISTPELIRQEQTEPAVIAVDRSQRTIAVLAKLEEPISMSFANETPLDDVLKYIKQATTTQTFNGIPIYVDPLGLQEAGRSLTSTITIDLEGVPLKTTLRLLLKQLGLAYLVRDGRLVISSIQGIRNSQPRRR